MQEGRRAYSDVVIIGAGISGIGAACHLRMKLPQLTFNILEGRSKLGGTWDIFRYPGVRTDSDMFTMAYSFNPWEGDEATAAGDTVLSYIESTAEKYDVKRCITFDTKVRKACWDSQTSLWTVHTDQIQRNSLLGTHSTEERNFECRFLLMCSGFTNYDKEYTPSFPGTETFRGPIIHPQTWPSDLDYANKKVVVIGSGATAITIVPQLAKTAKVTMLQRSPTYVVQFPRIDPLASIFNKYLPRSMFSFIRQKNIFLMHFLYRLAEWMPGFLKKLILLDLWATLPSGYDVTKHFSPRYKPWEQRICLSPDNDLVKAINDGSCTVVTDEIQTFTPSGIQLKSGGEIPADIIVTATGAFFLSYIALFTDLHLYSHSDSPSHLHYHSYIYIYIYIFLSLFLCNGHHVTAA
jgi:cation diffusion facilitator CzcD-associated flavoprotein CzcO